MKAFNAISPLLLILIGCGETSDPEATDPKTAKPEPMPHENRVILKKVILRLEKGQDVEDGFELALLSGKDDASIEAIERLQEECKELMTGLRGRGKIQQSKNDGLTAEVSTAFLSTSSTFLRRILKEIGGEHPPVASLPVSLEEMISKIKKLLDE